MHDVGFFFSGRLQLLERESSVQLRQIPPSYICKRTQRLISTIGFSFRKTVNSLTHYNSLNYLFCYFTLLFQLLNYPSPPASARILQCSLDCSPTSRQGYSFSLLVCAFTALQKFTCEDLELGNYREKKHVIFLSGSELPHSILLLKFLDIYQQCLSFHFSSYT